MVSIKEALKTRKVINTAVHCLFIKEEQKAHFHAQTSGSIVVLMYFWKAKGPKYVVFIYITLSLGLAKNVLFNRPVFLNSEMAELCVSMPFGRI